MSSPTPPSSPPNLNSETTLQPFFILPPKPRKKLNFPSNSDVNQLRVNAFESVWSSIDMKINQVLTDITTNVFDEIHRWVITSFSKTRSVKSPSPFEVMQTYPLLDIDDKKSTVIDCVNIRRVFTAFVFTSNVEFVDDLTTFEKLGVWLSGKGCHVVNMSALEFRGKEGVGLCVKGLVKGLVGVEGCDFGVVAAWYSEEENIRKPVIVVIDDVERCSEGVLEEFVMMLGEWVLKVPVFLVLGVSSEWRVLEGPRGLLSFNALQKLNPVKFKLSSPTEKLSKVVEEVFLKGYSGFDVSHKVMVFMKSYFLRHDGSVTGFIRGVKIACMKHFMEGELSYLARGMVDENYESYWMEECEGLDESMLKCVFDLPSCEVEDESCFTGESLAKGLSEIKKLRDNWSIVFTCLNEAAKLSNVQLLDILCEALNPESYKLKAFSSRHSGVGQLYSVDQKGGYIYQAMRKVKDLPLAALSHLVQFWKDHSEGIAELHSKVIELESMLKPELENQSLKPEETMKAKMAAARALEKCTRKINEKAFILLEFMVKEYLKPVECAQFHEIVCFKHVGVLQSSLIGDPRKTIQVDLLKSQTFLNCSCCSKSGDALLPSMHDTSIMYTLVQEHGDLINVHDWYQSFKANICRPSTTKGKRKIHSPSPKKRKVRNEPDEVMSEASLQARFCRAVTELQITGLLRMPSKRRPDFVQRVAFGI